VSSSLGITVRNRLIPERLSWYPTKRCFGV
jgi:hypothetical protein